MRLCFIIIMIMSSFYIALFTFYTYQSALTIFKELACEIGGTKRLRPQHVCIITKIINSMDQLSSYDSR